MDKPWIVCIKGLAKDINSLLVQFGLSKKTSVLIDSLCTCFRMQEGQLQHLLLAKETFCYGNGKDIWITSRTIALEA